MFRPGLALAVLLVTACTAVPPAPPAAVAPSIAAFPPQPTAARSTPIGIGGVAFGAPAADDLRALTGNRRGEYQLGFRPEFRGATSTAKGIQHGNYELETFLPSPFGEAWAATTVRTGHVGAATDPAAFARDVALPLVTAWSRDGKLHTGYHRLPDLGAQRAGIVRPDDPTATADAAAIVKNAGWPLAYVSEANREALFFYEGGVVLQLGWAEKRFTATNVPVPLAAAIATVRAAMRDPATTGEEARTGLDHFLGVPYAGVYPPPDGNRHDDFVPTYEVPDAVPFSGFLGVEYAEKPVWYVQGGWGGGGLVDALTGKLIRFTNLRVGHGTGGPPAPFTPPQS